MVPAKRLFGSRFSLCLAAAALLCGCDRPAEVEPSLVGVWLGEGQPGVAEKIVYVSELKADGTFRSEFRKYDGCRVVETNIESGTWRLDGDTEEMITSDVNGTPVNFGNTYTIELLTATEQRARLQKNGYVFVEKRLPRFEFPACQEGG